MAWEIYELSAQQDENKYRVAISVTREKRRGIAGFAKRVLDRFGNVIRQGDNKSAEITISFDRVVSNPSNARRVPVA